MDKEFQTTFIPKQPLTPPPTSSFATNKGVEPIGIFSLIAGILFVAGLAMTGGAFAYEYTLKNRIATMEESLARTEKAFEPSLIVELQRLDRRLSVANDLLRGHIAVSPVFRVIEESTLRQVKYDTFNFVFENSQASVTMSGIAQDYRTIAEQSLIFGSNRFINNHLFSKFALNTRGQVTFDVALNLSSDLVLFDRSLGRVPGGSSVTAPTSALDFLSASAQAIGEEPLETSQEVGIPGLDPVSLSTDTPMNMLTN
ncbi:MAG: hypothetical protein LRY41_02535 [Candidatus Pacebacteria bacterium]|nr:hypothetical protein [Candidatus Paceibacterota bacterium]MCD8508188.1 hypothetical protein [Candidatus Paceibacterota bacterium]MCD8528179.1 hypothetical protein [Candidatus Paceibacterota bacterium]MCD8563449.1 hypothetical protein [Candidatus Paceibacterota bacterium]